MQQNPAHPNQTKEQEKDLLAAFSAEKFKHGTRFAMNHVPDDIDM